jgi:hypothetical protein
MATCILQSRNDLQTVSFAVRMLPRRVWTPIHIPLLRHAPRVAPQHTGMLVRGTRSRFQCPSYTYDNPKSHQIYRNLPRILSLKHSLNMEVLETRTVIDQVNREMKLARRLSSLHFRSQSPFKVQSRPELPTNAAARNF